MENNQILKTIADNPLLEEALRKLLKKQFEFLPIPSASLSDEILGQQTRARIVGMVAVNKAFEEIANYKTIPDQPESKNPAR